MQPAAEARKSILIVEDEGLIADDIQRRLERLGYSVPAIASTGEEALRFARSFAFDLVLMDIRLKGDMDGIAAADRLRREFHAPVVYLTAHADQDTVSRAALTEPFGYILKPIADSSLRSVLQIALYKHEMESRLRASEAWLSTTLRSIGDGILATDPDGAIVFLNAAAARLTGCTAEDAKGRPLLEILSLRDERTGDPASNPVVDLFPDETRAYQLAPRAAGAFPVEVQCFENRDGEETFGAIIVVRDIRARRESEAQLIQSQRMAAIAALSGGLAADFSGMLSRLGSQADDLYSQLAGASREQAGEIRHGLSRASALTAQLAALSNPGPAQNEAIPVHDTIAGFRDSLAACLGEHIALEIAPDPAPGYIHADPARFHQLLLNLAIHAREALPQGGSWRIESSVIELAASDSLSRRSASQWFVELRSTGSNQSASLDMFEPRFGPQGGNRFPLAIAHAIVAHAGGRITASSAGIEILLPCIATHHPADSRSTALLIEEEDELRRAMVEALLEEGFQVIAARNITHAEWAAAAHRHPIVMLISDATGTPLAERLHIPANLLVSGYRRFASSDGAALVKPFPIEEFRRRIRAFVPLQA